ncbi:HXXEE domain-containing protein [Lysinibacillus sp. NPDC093712]|uniref:HXXEE domain-containing protein n=1 Tax=Lysinibacillus sp. NPDC093712 TaxID=3390579 RepID=UPI003D038507
MVEQWLHNNQKKLYKRLPLKLADRIVKQFSMTTAQFAVAVIIVFLFVSGVTIAANLHLYNGLTMNFYFFILVSSVFFIHAFTHIGQTIFFRSISSGTVTSIIIIIPYSVLLYRSLLFQGIITWKMNLISLPFGLLFLDK